MASLNTQEIEISDHQLSNMRLRAYSETPLEAAIRILKKELGEPFISHQFNLPALKDRASHLYVTTPTSLSDSHFLERVCCMAIEDAINWEHGLQIRFRFQNFSRT